jgi:hypothetical protein
LVSTFAALRRSRLMNGRTREAVSPHRAGGDEAVSASAVQDEYHHGPLFVRAGFQF